MMAWHSVGDFFAMGGYALYVWGSMAGVVVCLGGEMTLLARSTAAVLATARSAPPAAAKTAATGGRSSHGVQDEATA